MPRGRRAKPNDPQAQSYSHEGQLHPARPDIGIQPEYEARAPRKPPKTYRYDPSLDPALSWDGNPAREQGEHLIQRIQEQARIAADRAAPQQARTDALVRLRGAADELAAMGKAFLNWSGKDGGPALSVPTLPLFVHERLSTRAVLESVRGMKRTKVQALSLFADEGLDIDDRIFGAYEHAAPWTNRLILGDSLAVMNSLLEYEGLGGKVQMIYMDPPYGVKFGSNFQPFVRRREVKHGDDGHLTREPEMVQAYRDTWELGLHSYLTYLRDRLSLARELLHLSGSVLVQISDENLHHVREVLDEIFGAHNCVATIPFRKKTMPLGAKFIEQMDDFLLWYAKDKESAKYKQPYVDQSVEGDWHYQWADLPDGTSIRLTPEQVDNHALLPDGRVSICLNPLNHLALWLLGWSSLGTTTWITRTQETVTVPRRTDFVVWQQQTDWPLTESDSPTSCMRTTFPSLLSPPLGRIRSDPVINRTSCRRVGPSLLDACS